MGRVAWGKGEPPGLFELKAEGRGCWLKGDGVPWLSHGIKCVA